MSSGKVEDKAAGVEISVTGVPGECACFDGNLLSGGKLGEVEGTGGERS